MPRGILRRPPWGWAHAAGQSRVRLEAYRRSSAGQRGLYLEHGWFHMGEGGSDRAERYAIVDFEGEQAFHTLHEDWERLWWQSSEATQSQTWDWQYMYWKHLAPTTRPVVIVAQDSQGMCVALAAFFMCRDQVSWVSKAAFLGDKRPDYHLMLVMPNLPETVGCQILEHFVLKFKTRAPFIELSNIPLNSYTGRVIQQFFQDDRRFCPPTLQWQTQTYAVSLPATVDKYQEQLGPRSRRDFHYEKRLLSKEFSVEFRVCSTLEDLDSTLDAIETIDRARWGVNSRYCIGSQREFDRSVARALCEMGIYRAFVLYLNGKPSAYVAGAVVRNALKVATIGYDRSLPGKFSPGKVTNFYTIEYCIQQGYSEYDLTRGSEDYKKWMGGRPCTNVHVRLYRSRLDALMESRGQRLVSFLRNQSWLRSAYQRWLRK